VTCVEALELAAADALGALEPEERAALEAHLAGPGPHEGCPEAVDRARFTAAELARALPEVKPDPGVWRAIEARTGSARRRAPWLGPAGWAAAAAAAVALVVLQVDRQTARRDRELASREREVAGRALAQAEAERDQLRGQLQVVAGTAALQQQALALLDRPGTRLVPLAPQEGQTARGVAIVNVREGSAVIASSALPPQPGKTYQLWVIRGTAPPAPAGFLRATERGAAGEVNPALLRGAPPDALAVSLEPAGGSLSPTQVLMVGRVAG
jgi:anti-sigma-K factor RskA